MARMPDKKTLLRLPLPKLPKHGENDTCITATIEAVDCKWVLNLYIRKPKKEIRVFFWEGKWKNYIITENKWSGRTIEGNQWGYDNSWVTSHSHREYKTDRDSIGAIGTYFGIGVNIGLYKCLRAIEDMQSRLQNEKHRKKIHSEGEKRAAAKELFSRLDIPPLPSKINPVIFREAFTWQEYYYTVTYCPNCGEVTYNLTKTCDYCGSDFINIRDVAAMRNRQAAEDGRTFQMYKSGQTVYVVVYKIDKNITFTKNTRYLRDGFTATETEKCYPLECYVFAPGGKIHTFYSWQNYGNDKIYLKGEKWYYAGSDIWYNQSEFEPLSEEELQGTVLANLHYKEYRQRKRARNESVDTLKYIEFFHKYPVAENLLMNGFTQILKNSMYNPGYARQVLRLKQARLYKMLGLNKDEQQRARQEQWTLTMLKNYREYRDRGKILPYSLLKLLGDVTDTYNKNIIRIYADIYDVALYMAKQNSRYGRNRSLSYWYDYIEAAEDNGYDVTDKAVLYPPDVEKAHDRAILMRKNKVNEKLIQSFNTLYEAYSQYSFEKDGICIRIAHSEDELIKEGQILCHCVGGYGERHIKGRSIFFIRRTEQPEAPWYTLQVNLKTGMKLQLHGYQNDRNTPIPQEVHDFVNYWLDNIFRPFDVDKMEFIKQVKKKTA